MIVLSPVYYNCVNRTNLGLKFNVIDNIVFYIVYWVMYIVYTIVLYSVHVIIISVYACSVYYYVRFKTLNMLGRYVINMHVFTGQTKTMTLFRLDITILYLPRRRHGFVAQFFLIDKILYNKGVKVMFDSVKFLSFP